jgi:hypothetical protein
MVAQRGEEESCAHLEDSMVFLNGTCCLLVAMVEVPEELHPHLCKGVRLIPQAALLAQLKMQLLSCRHMLLCHVCLRLH